MISSVLSDEQIERIHAASLAILADTGVVVPHTEMLRLFSDAGARVNFDEQRVRIPSEVVLRLVAQASHQFVIYGRDLSHRASFGIGECNYNSSAG